MEIVTGRIYFISDSFFKKQMTRNGDSDKKCRRDSWKFVLYRRYSGIDYSSDSLLLMSEALYRTFTI
jgi:hypothetical protein